MKRGSHSVFPIISRHPFIVSAWLHVSQEETVEGLALVRGVRCVPFTADVCRRGRRRALWNPMHGKGIEASFVRKNKSRCSNIYHIWNRAGFCRPGQSRWHCICSFPSVCRIIRRMASNTSKQGATMTRYYCKYCGQAFPTISSLTSGKCMRHPDGPCEGRHALYEGSEKSRYTCKYCGQAFPTISSLTSGKCMRHPDGSCKGRHSPAL